MLGFYLDSLGERRLREFFVLVWGYGSCFLELFILGFVVKLRNFFLGWTGVSGGRGGELVVLRIVVGV